MPEGLANAQSTMRILGRIAYSQRLAPILLLFASTLFLWLRSDLFRFDPEREFQSSGRYYDYDDVAFELPVVHYFHERLAKGEFALWNPYQSTGNPMIGTLQQRLLYPPRLVLTLILGLQVGQFMEILFHTLLAVGGTYLMLRTIGIDRAAAATGAFSVLLSYEFQYATYSHNVFATLSWVPICFVAIRKYVAGPTPGNSALLALCFSMMIYAGYPQYAYYAAHACLVILAVSLIENRKERFARPLPFLSCLALAGLLFVLVTLPQIMTAAEFFTLGIRGVRGITLAQFHLFAGIRLDQLIPRVYSENPSPVLHVITLVIIVAPILAWSRFPQFRIHILGMVCIAVPFALLAMGDSTPFATWYYNHYPMGSTFRAPRRALYVLLFPCAFAIALSVQLLLHIKIKTVPIRGTYLLIPITLCALLVPGVHFRTHAFVNSFGYMQTFVGDLKKAIPAGSNHRFVTITGFQTEPYRRAGMMAERRSFSEYEPSNTYRFFLYSTFVSAQLKSMGNLVWLGDAQLTYDALADPSALRFLQGASVDRIIGDAVEWKNRPESLRQEIRRNSILREETSIQDSRTIDRARRQMGQANFEIFSKYAGSDFPLYRVFHIRDSLPRAYTTNKIRFASNLEDSVKQMEKQFNPLTETMIETPLASALETAKTSPTDSFKSAQFVADEPERIVLRTYTTGDSYLVLNDKFFTGWECRIDGRKAEIVPANILFRAVRLPSGDHVVEFSYNPGLLYITLAIAVFAFTICVVLVALATWKTFRNGR